MRHILLILTTFYSTISLSGQTYDNIVGSYIKIDSTSSSFEKEGKWYKNIDTTLLTFNKDMTFSYKWSPAFGAYSNSHILTTGNWKVQEGKILLNSKYQQDEYRFFESYKPEFGDSLVKIYVQTYDSLIGFFQFQFIGVVRDSTRKSEMIFKDKDYPYNACSVIFPLPYVDKIIFYGDFGRMPVIKPKDKKSNSFLLQYNLSDNWDYQYFKDFEVKIIDGVATLGNDKDNRMTLKKL